jgi:hypothetical protein
LRANARSLHVFISFFGRKFTGRHVEQAKPRGSPLNLCVPLASGRPSLAAFQLFHECTRRDDAICFGHEGGDFAPPRSDVKANADPAALADIRWPKESLGVARDEVALQTLGSGAPDRQASVPVMVVQEHEERRFAAYEKARRTMAHALRRFG